MRFADAMQHLNLQAKPVSVHLVEARCLVYRICVTGDKEGPARQWPVPARQSGRYRCNNSGVPGRVGQSPPGKRARVPLFRAGRMRRFGTVVQLARWPRLAFQFGLVIQGPEGLLFVQRASYLSMGPHICSEGLIFVHGPLICPGGLLFVQGASYLSREPHICPGGLLFVQRASYLSRVPGIYPGGLLFSRGHPTCSRDLLFVQGASCLSREPPILFVQGAFSLSSGPPTSSGASYLSRGPSIPPWGPLFCPGGLLIIQESPFL